MSTKDSPYFWFFLTITFISVSFLTYLWVRWVKPQGKGIVRQISGVLLFGAVALLFVQPVVYRRAADVREPATLLLAWVSYAVMGFLAIFLIYTFFWDVLISVWRLVYYGVRRVVQAKGQGSGAPSAERRRFLWKASRLSIASVSLGSGTLGIAQAMRGPRLVEVQVPVEDLHPDLEGFRITQISDLHIGPTIGQHYIQQVVELVGASQPDMIALTGDLVDGSVSQLEAEAQILGKLQAPQGTYFCTGNHEYFSGALEWIDFWKKQGLEVLANSHQIIRRGSAQILVGGVYDPSAYRLVPEHRCDPERSLKGAPQVDFKILLAHQPSTYFEAHRVGYDLMLSGHTHGGQFFPWSLFVPLAHRYNRGLHLHGDRLWVYVNSGTGYWGPPLRLGLPAEVTQLVLTRAPRSSA